MRSRRGILLGATAVAACGVGVVALDSAPVQETNVHSRDSLAPLRGVMPAAHMRLVSLDLPDGQAVSRAILMAQLQRAVVEADRGQVAAWLALGGNSFQGGRRLPHNLREMPSFTGDLIESIQAHGDVLLQIVGPDSMVVRRVAERLVKSAAEWNVRWQIDGFRTENRVEGGRGLSDNPLHFSEGFGNPATKREMADRAVVRPGQGEPDWAVGGSYHVVRIIRVATELWDRDPVREQERIIGRRRDGRWLDGTPSDEQPNFAADLRGKFTPLDSHVRLATPDRRNPPPLVRQSYSYDRGNGDTGLIFSCFQRDLAKGFEAVQERLEGEAMAKYMLTTGGGYFFVPPPGNSWVDALFES